MRPCMDSYGLTVVTPTGGNSVARLCMLCMEGDVLSLASCSLNSKQNLHSCYSFLWHRIAVSTPVEYCSIVAATFRSARCWRGHCVIKIQYYSALISINILLYFCMESSYSIYRLYDTFTAVYLNTISYYQWCQRPSASNIPSRIWPKLFAGYCWLCQHTIYS